MADLLKMRFDRFASTAARDLDHSLEWLAQCVDRARADLAAGKPLDHHLIVNAGMITGYIAQHNLCLELAPYLEEEVPHG